jgi:hypothetical protein
LEVLLEERNLYPFFTLQSHEIRVVGFFLKASFKQTYFVLALVRANGFILNIREKYELSRMFEINLELLQYTLNMFISSIQEMSFIPIHKSDTESKNLFKL